MIKNAFAYVTRKSLKSLIIILFICVTGYQKKIFSSLIY